MLGASIFSFSHHVIYPSVNKFQFFSRIYFVVYNCFQFRSSLKFCRLVKSERSGKYISLFCTLSLTLSQTTNFRLLPNSKSLQTTISNVMKMAESSLNGSKTLWEKEKLLVKGNFSFFPLFSKDLFCRLIKTRALGKG